MSASPVFEGDGSEPCVDPKYLASSMSYALLSSATHELELLAITRGAYKRTRRRMVRAAAVVVLVGGMLGLVTPRTSHATPSFAAPVANAFGLGPISGYSSPAFADIDGDGDLDAFVGSLYFSGGSKYVDTAFFENTGTASAPAFAAPVYNPFGLSGSDGPNVEGDQFHGNPALADIDGDGDLDYFIQSAASGTSFYENTGTVNAPAFTLASAPTGMSQSSFGPAVAFADIDDDGDLDLFQGAFGGGYGSIEYQENTGAAMAPSFAAPVADPFGLSAPDQHPSPVFVDIDGDGDLDFFVGKYAGGMNFRANGGTPMAPSFGSSVSNPFGFIPASGYSSKPAFADIDDDGDLDLFVGTNYGNVYFYLNLEIDQCGNGVDGGNEVCDGLDLDDQTCETQGLDGGTLACAGDCLSFDASACVGVPCAPTPSGVCLAPGKGQLQVRDNADPSKDQLKFKWQKGPMFDHGMLGAPNATTNHALCIYDRTADAPTLVARVGVPANGLWVDKNPKGFQLKDKNGTNDGVTKMQLKPGAAGKTGVSVQAKGANLELPGPVGIEYFDQDPSVTVQVVSDAGLCWSADFAPGSTSKNDGAQFKGKTP